MDELYQNLVRLSPKEQVPFRCIGASAVENAAGMYICRFRSKRWMRFAL